MDCLIELMRFECDGSFSSYCNLPSKFSICSVFKESTAREAVELARATVAWE